MSYPSIFHMTWNAALGLPGVKELLAMRSGSTGANRTVDPDSVMIEWAEKVKAEANRHGADISGARLVEVGPGHSLGVGLCLLLEGAQSVQGLDVTEYTDIGEISKFSALSEKWNSKNSSAERLSTVISGLSHSVITATGPWNIESDSIDIVYSYFAGEHLRSPSDTLSEARRILKKDGICMFAIDLRNHLDHQGNWLAHLYHGDWTWDAMTSRRGHWTNRLLTPDWRQIFDAKFEILEFETRSPPAPAGFDSRKLAKRFQAYPPEMLGIDYIWAVGRKISAL